MKRKSSFHVPLTSAAVAGLLTSCGTIANLMPPTYQPTPESIRMGSSAENVKSILGKPDWAEPFTAYNEETDTISNGSVWHYTDHWWKQKGWGSWDVYFDTDRKYVGWRLTSPDGSEPNDREVFHVRRNPPVGSSYTRPTNKVTEEGLRIARSPTPPHRKIELPAGSGGGDVLVDPHTGRYMRVLPPEADPTEDPRVVLSPETPYGQSWEIEVPPGKRSGDIIKDPHTEKWIRLP